MCEKDYKYFVQDCLKSLFFVLTFVKMHGSFQNDQFLAKKSKNSLLVLPHCNWASFSTKSVVEAEMQLALLRVYQI